MRRADIIAAFDATDITGQPAALGQVCTVCAGPISPYPDGRPCLCRSCTMRELGLHERVLSLMIEFRLSRNACQARLDKYGTPDMTLKAWLTPKSWKKGIRGG